MPDEKTNEGDTAGKEVNTEVKEVETTSDEGLSIVDEAKKIRDEIRSENDRREKILKEEQTLRANNLLGGTTGGRVESTPKKELTDKEYAKQALSGEFNDKKV